MKDKNRTKKQPTLEALRKQVEELTKSESKYKEIEKVIKASANEWRTTFDSIKDAICLLDIERKIIRCNKAVSDLFAKPFTEIVGHTCCEIVHGTSEPFEGCPVLIMKKTLKREALILPLNNRWFEVTADPIFNESDGLSGAVYVLTDITERKQAEDALRDSEERFRNLMEYIPESIQGYKLDGTIFYWNKASEKVYGYTAKEAIGKNLGDLIVPSNLKPLFNKCLETAKKIKQSGEFMPSGELLLLHKEGHLVPIYSIHTAVYIDGKEPLLFCIDVDLSEHKKAQEALRESEYKFRSLFDLSPQAVALTDIETGRLIDVNDEFCELSQYDKKEILGRTTIERGFYSENDRNRFIKELKEKGEVIGLEMDFKAKDASTINALMFSRIIQLKGTPLILTVFFDKTEQKKVEEIMQKNEKELQKRVKELEDFYQMAVGRELKMIQLKEEIESLKKELEKYKNP